MYGKELKEHIKSEVEGSYQECLIALLCTPVELDARALHKSLNLIGTDTDSLIEILASRSNEQLKEIKEFYKNKYNSDLDDDLKSDLHFSIGEALRALASASRPEDTNVNLDQANEDAQTLFDAGEGNQYGTHESEFVRILCSRSFAQLRKMFESYAAIAGKDISDAIKTETTGDFEEVLIAIVECVRDPQAFFARELHKNMQGLGKKH